MGGGRLIEARSQQTGVRSQDPAVKMQHTAFVVGGAGFVGSHLVELLVGEGWKVRVPDDLSTGRLSNLAAVADKIEFTRGGITDQQVVRVAVSGSCVETTHRHPEQSVAGEARLGMAEVYPASAHLRTRV